MVAAVLASGLVWQLEWLSPHPLVPLWLPAVPYQTVPSIPLLSASMRRTTLSVAACTSGQTHTLRPDYDGSVILKASCLPSYR